MPTYFFWEGQGNEYGVGHSFNPSFCFIRRFMNAYYVCVCMCERKLWKQTIYASVNNDEYVP